MASYSAVVNHLRQSFQRGKMRSVATRKTHILALKAMLTENEKVITDAVYQDIHRCYSEAICYELNFVLNEIKTALSDIDQWVRPEPVQKNLLQILDDAFIEKDPLGVVLVLAPWNYPIQLSFCAMVGALAAGNCVILKPSEMAPHSSAVYAKLVGQYMDQDVCRVIEGGVPETTQLLRERFDHIFYTGSPMVGKIVMQAASKFLTPVTLELGGKSPVIIDESFDLDLAAKRVTWGKFLSAGQTCLAPDYVLISERQKPKFIESVKKWVKEFYGENPQKSNDYSRIINSRHFDRVSAYLKSGNIVHGGRTDRDDVYIEPTVIENVDLNEPLMQDEIFGPIMVLVTYKTIEDTIELINSREKPLALYIFSKNEAMIKKVLNETSSGGVTVNDCLLHISCDTLPFGGVGNSGMGSYHGKFSFDTFTHHKSVLKRKETGEQILWMRYPPYNDSKLFWAKIMTEKRSLPQLYFLKYVPMFIIGVILGYFLQRMGIF